MQIATLRLLITFGLTFGLWFTTAWAVTDNQEAICDQPYVIFCDNYEARALGASDLRRSTYKNGGWEYPFPQNWPTKPTGITNEAGTFFSGSKSLRMTIPQGYNTGGPYLVGWMVQGAPDVYIRWYWKFSSNFVWSPTANKGLGISPINQRATNVMGQSPPPTGSNPHMYTTTGVIPDGACASGPAGTIDAYHLCQQINPVINMAPNQWYCIEVRVKNSTAPTTNKVSDGRITAWIDKLDGAGAVQVMDYPNLNIEYQTPAGSGRNWWTLWNAAGVSCGGGAYAADGFNCVPQNQESFHPEQYRWQDNVVVATQRIGCLGTAPPPGDTTPPPAPANLRVSSLWEQIFEGFLDPSKPGRLIFISLAVVSQQEEEAYRLLE